MKNLFKIFLFLLILSFTLVLASCNSNGCDCEKCKDFCKNCEECNGTDDDLDDDDDSNDFVNVNGNYALIEVKGYGTITVLLDRNAAPETVAQFAKLANDGFYDGLTFHRVISDFMIQGGDPNADGTGGYIVDGVKQTIKGEFSKNGHDNGLKFARGVLGMARGEDYNSASSQFFICNADSSSVTNLDGSYAAFGRVIEGIEVVDAVTSATAGHATDGNGGVPKDEQIVIKSIRVVSDVSVKGFGPSVWNPSNATPAAPSGDENETEEDFIN